MEKTKTGINNMLTYNTNKDNKAGVNINNKINSLTKFRICKFPDGARSPQGKYSNYKLHQNIRATSLDRGALTFPRLRSIEAGSIHDNHNIANNRSNNKYTNINNPENK